MAIILLCQTEGSVFQVDVCTLPGEQQKSPWPSVWKGCEDINIDYRSFQRRQKEGGVQLFVTPRNRQKCPLEGGDLILPIPNLAELGLSAENRAPEGRAPPAGRRGERQGPAPLLRGHGAGRWDLNLFLFIKERHFYLLGIKIQVL